MPDGRGAVPGDVVLNQMTGLYHRVVSIHPEPDSNGDIILHVKPGYPLMVGGPPRESIDLVAKGCTIVDLPSAADLVDPDELDAWLES